MKVSRWIGVLTILSGQLSCADEEQPGPAVGHSRGPLSDISQAELARRQEMFRAWERERRQKLTIVATTVTRTGQTIDWIPIESQTPDGKVPTPPPVPPPPSCRVPHLRPFV